MHVPYARIILLYATEARIRFIVVAVRVCARTLVDRVMRRIRATRDIYAG